MKNPNSRVSGKHFTKFRLNGKEIDKGKIGGIAHCVLAFISRIPDGDLLGVKEVAAGMGRNYLTVRDCLENKEFTDYCTVVRHPRRMKVVGNKRTIAELLKRNELLA